jgi:preprotein translocase subunit YajC
LLQKQYHGIKQAVKLRYVTQSLRFTRERSLCIFSFLTALILLLDTAAQRACAQAAAAPSQPGFSEVLSKMAPMFLIVFVVFHFFIIKPQKQKEAQHAELIKNLKVGEAVSTSSGMIGRVAAIAADVITLEIASNVKVKFTPTSIVKIEETK